MWFFEMVDFIFQVLAGIFDWCTMAVGCWISGAGDLDDQGLGDEQEDTGEVSSISVRHLEVERLYGLIRDLMDLRVGEFARVPSYHYITIRSFLTFWGDGLIRAHSPDAYRWAGGVAFDVAEGYLAELMRIEEEAVRPKSHGGPPHGDTKRKIDLR